MVQKYQSPVRVYKHPFELIMLVSVFQIRQFECILPFDRANRNKMSFSEIGRQIALTRVHSFISCMYIGSSFWLTMKV